jgi:hypothetical protein
MRIASQYKQMNTLKLTSGNATLAVIVFRLGKLSQNNQEPTKGDETANKPVTINHHSIRAKDTLGTFAYPRH